MSKRSFSGETNSVMPHQFQNLMTDVLRLPPITYHFFKVIISRFFSGNVQLVNLPLFITLQETSPKECVKGNKIELTVKGS